MNQSQPSLNILVYIYGMATVLFELPLVSSGIFVLAYDKRTTESASDYINLEG